MKAFLRENLMIVVSISLPLLVAVFFTVASVLPPMLAAPPGHDLLLSLHGRSTARSSQLNIKYVVENNRVRVLATRPEEPHMQETPRLFRYDHLKDVVTEVNIPIPEDVSSFINETELDVPGLSGLQVIDTLASPDGWEFRGRRRSGGLITELFGTSRNRTDISIAKNGAVKRLRIPASDYWYNDVRFVAWVTQ